MEKIVITGPTGAIGTALIDKCLRENCEVTVICHRNSKRIKNLPKSEHFNVEFCNLNELDRLPELFGGKKMDWFFHLAWEGTFGRERDELKGQVENIRYTLDAVNAAHALGCTTFIGAGSQAEYGRKNVLLTPDLPPFPENGYGMAKLCAGQMSRKMCEQYGMRHIWPRILSVYGPNDREETMIMSVIRKFILMEDAELSKGGQMWDYLYSEDAAEALYLLGKKGVHGKVYPVGSGEVRPLFEYAECIKECMGSTKNLLFGKIPYRSDQVMYLGADISELVRDTGFCVKHTFEEGIKKTIEWAYRKFQI